MDVGFTNDYRSKRLGNYQRVARWTEGHEALVKFGAAFVMAALTACLAQIAIYTPLSPVPYTGQVLGIALMGELLGRKWGTISASLYLGLGLLGLPVFAGAWATFESFEAFSGFAAFTTSLSAGYLLGFVLQAYIIGHIADRRNTKTNRPLVSFATLTIAGLILFALLDVYFLTNYAALYPNSPTAFPNPWFFVLSASLLILAAGGAWLAFTSKARRERIELFMGNIVGLLALYAVGAVFFYGLWVNLGKGALDFMTLLRYTVLPFIPADLTKILLAIGILTLVRPTNAELAAAVPAEASAKNV